MEDISGVVEADALLTSSVGESISFVISNRQGPIFHGKLLSRFFSHIKFLLRKFDVKTPFATVYERIVPE